MTAYGQNPYDDNQKRTGGAVANGTIGSRTAASQQNAGTQAKAGSNPYADYGNLGSAWAGVLNQYMQKPATTARPQTGGTIETGDNGMRAQPMARHLDNPNDGGETGDGWGDNQQTPPPPVTMPIPASTVPPPPGATPPPAAPPPTAPPPAEGAPPPAPHPQFTPQADPDPIAQRTKPPNVTDQTWGIAQRWVSEAGPGYEWLLDKPEVVDQYTKEAYDLEALGVTGLHFTDWARERGYDSPIDKGTLRAPQAYARLGGDDHSYATMVRWLADGSSKYGVDAMRDYATQLQRTPGLISSYESDMQQAEKAGITGIHFVDWLAENESGFRSPLAGQMGPESARAAHQWRNYRATGVADDPAGPMWEGGPPPAPPGFTPPPGTMGGPPVTPTTPTPPVPNAPPPPVVEPGPPVFQPPHVDPVEPPPSGPITPDTHIPPDFDPSVLRAANVDYLDPVYKDAMDEVRRQMMQAGANSGQINSGGFGSSMAKGLSPIANQFAQQKGQLQFQAQQANADRILDKYKFDNAQDLQKFLAANSDALTREGIDKNIVLQQWLQNNKAQLEREGYDVQKWIADLNAKTGLQQASIGASAAGASANAASESARYNADRDYQLGHEQLGYNYWNSDQGRQYDNTFNQRGYDLGVLGINRDIYGMDQTQLRYLMGLMSQQSPDQRMSSLPLPGMQPY